MPMSQFDTFALEQNPVPKAANDNPIGFVAALDDQPIEGGFDPVFGDVTWQTLISGDKTQSNGLVLGVATFAAGGVLHLHRHTPPEFYFGLTGSGTVMLDGQPVEIVPGSAIFIPANAEHGVTAGPTGLTMAYGFGEDAFSEIEYRFSAAQ
ncbi:cupin domain-containing protein [Sulfitobacter sp. M57]|uniref:cupin domain-containing protein n=2 Tax=unclassified Sulfitobacter TaxID=196795 RepID=UPI0023E1C60E|nr:MULTISPECIES: cupin domain-containing protein [unclassified Sulfitobacter]MDF3457892.1 cupin domain-containing protein [Sulfitobacter sp. S74]MDF3477240.1 cupin domain-containing protein [Sulfitobacter sp. M53]MDF3481139.1 cupin domain-containing protein [Sulfitobacter sp. M24]MDF3485035.1 cupin domain-containing protein [Sulfitobacter sp. Ks13]MDF3413707.1 cupin domain-containing protein [Sulfitobacter sp. KE5]